MNAKNSTIVPENVSILFKKGNIQRLLKTQIKKIHNNKSIKIYETCVKLCMKWERPQQ
jgi:hypothetical protein